MQLFWGKLKMGGKAGLNLKGFRFIACLSKLVVLENIIQKS